MSEIKGKKVLIVGFGREGKSALRFLERYHPEADIFIRDKQYDGDSYLDEIGDYDTVIKSPGIPPDKRFKKAKHLTTLTDIFFDACPGTVIGITGTKGKSTTATLTAHILKQFRPDVRLVGNVGNPALDYLEHSTRESVFVMELSSFQLTDIHYPPHIAVLLPIYREHLDYHKTFANYISAKANITKFQTSSDYLIYYAENKFCQKIAEKSKAQKKSFYKFAGNTPLAGEANKINSAAAFTAANFLVPDGRAILASMQSFEPLPHRLEKIGVFRRIEFVNDSLATIPEATMHALETLGEGVETLIAGGHDRGINFSKLGKALSRSSVKTLILFPDTGDKIEKALKSVAPRTKIKILKTDKMHEAARFAFENTREGKICLLSPASSSFNLFKDYEARGNAFRQEVEKLAK